MVELKFTVMNRNRKLITVGAVLAGIAICAMLLLQPIQRNLAFLEALKVALRQPCDYPQAVAVLKPLARNDCRVNWQLILLAYDSNDHAEIEADWKQLLGCTPEAIDWLFQMFPERTDMASAAAELYPNEPQAWFWLGEQANQTGDQLVAIQYFSETVRLQPSDGLGWCRLGYLYEGQEMFQAAIDAYWQCCSNGDPGSNGCYGAGRNAEKVGDTQAAIQYYRRSHWLPAQQRADALEASQ